jgi:hypothetical protein
MKTKEEILEASFKNEYPANVYVVSRLKLYELVTIPAMDEYAKQEAIEFCQDILNNIEVNGVKLSDYKKVDVPELYKIFQQSKSINV